MAGHGQHQCLSLANLGPGFQFVRVFAFGRSAWPARPPGWLDHHLGQPLLAIIHSHRSIDMHRSLSLSRVRLLLEVEVLEVEVLKVERPSLLSLGIPYRKYL